MGRYSRRRDAYQPTTYVEYSCGLNWTNWTFGIWFGRINRKTKAFGIDLGPFEMLWQVRD